MGTTAKKQEARAPTSLSLPNIIFVVFSHEIDIRVNSSASVVLLEAAAVCIMLRQLIFPFFVTNYFFLEILFVCFFDVFMLRSEGNIVSSLLRLFFPVLCVHCSPLPAEPVLSTGVPLELDMLDSRLSLFFKLPSFLRGFLVSSLFLQGLVQPLLEGERVFFDSPQVARQEL